MKPYVTGRLLVVDNVNLIDNLGLVGGEVVSFAFDAGEGQIYENRLHLLAVHGEQVQNGGRAHRYTMELVGPEYFANRQNQVQQSFRGGTGTSAIQQIHNRFIQGPLRILAASLGPLSQHAYVVSSRPPFTAIDEIRRRLTYAQYRTGNTLYYRDRDGHVLGPLEHLFSNLAGPTFIQEQTWGKNWFDVIRAQNAIIAAAASLDGNRENSNNGRIGMQNVSAAAVQEQRVFDFRTRQEVIRRIASRIGAGRVTGAVGSLLSPILGQFLGQGGHGGLANYQTTDSANVLTANDPTRDTMTTRLYSAIAGNGPGITFKVPIQSGLALTVGGGANLRLLPPMGDLNILQNRASGLYLVTNLTHTIALDARQFMATTTAEGIRGGSELS
jgi:hypothetical protein